MQSTTIRVDAETHASLLALATADGETLMNTVRAATSALRRQRFAERVAEEMHALQQNAVEWESYLSEAETTAVRDGIA